MNNDKTVVLFSGGVDSFLAWERLNHPDLLYVNLGHRYAEFEWAAISEKLSSQGGPIDSTLVKYVNCNWMQVYEKPDAEIPGRNLQLALVAASLGYNFIGLVCQKDERSIPDRSRAFFNATSDLLSSLFGRQILLDPVFADMDKTDMIGWYLNQPIEGGVRLKDLVVEERIRNLKLTVACYRPAEVWVSSKEISFSRLETRQCGNCPACFRRAVAFILNGIVEDYAQDVWQSEVAKDYRAKALSGYYGPERAGRILSAFERARSSG